MTLYNIVLHYMTILTEKVTGGQTISSTWVKRKEKKKEREKHERTKREREKNKQGEGDRWPGFSSAWLGRECEREKKEREMIEKVTGGQAFSSA